MPSPITHLAVGYAAYRWATSRRRGVQPGTRPDWMLLSTALFVAVFPDLDFAVGLALGDIGRYHNQGTHSLVGAIAVATFFAGLASLSGRGRFRTWFPVLLFCSGLHVVLDFFTVGRGVLVLWPFTSTRFASPVKLFYGVHWSDGLFTVRHVWTVLTELIAIALVLCVLAFWPRKANSVLPAESDPTTGK